MIVLEENIKSLCAKNGLDYVGFLADLDVEHPNELTVYDIQAIAEEYGLDVYGLLFKPLGISPMLRTKLEKIRLLVLDVDGVMTDGGMYFTENGDQIKKYNTKDGMAIMQLTKANFQVAIISSGFAPKMVERRAEMLNIQNCIVTREKKDVVLEELLNQLGMTRDEVAMIGDDINDLEVMKKIGLAICPADAVQAIKQHAHLVLQSKGGEGCVREFIDMYLTVVKPMVR